jgi:hypothetical protein
MMFENWVLRRIFVPKGEEVAGGWRKLYNEKLNNSYSFAKYNPNDQVKEDGMGRACSTRGREEECI